MEKQVIIDSHVHLFSKAVIENVSSKTAMADLLHLDTRSAWHRTSLNRLEQDAGEAGIEKVLLLPTSGFGAVSKANEASQALAESGSRIMTAGTLHPKFHDNPRELERLHALGIHAIKLCSFSQGFCLESTETVKLMEEISKASRKQECRHCVIFDTFFLAHQYFMTDPAFTTTPEKLGALVRQFTDIDFIAAHMGGLAAPFSQIIDHLKPCDNLFLDTSNAAHTLAEAEFMALLKLHGPEKILFGTDWPYFSFKTELSLVSYLIEKAGFSDSQKAMVMGLNSARLFLH